LESGRIEIVGPRIKFMEEHVQLFKNTARGSKYRE